MQTLQAVPWDGLSSVSLLHHVQQAAHRSRGLLLLHISEQTAQSSGLSLLQAQAAADATYQPGAPGLTGNGDCRVLAPAAVPQAAAELLHTLGCRLTQAQAMRLGLHSFELHGALDDLSDWVFPALGAEQRNYSRVMLTRCAQLDRHVDRGLFNAVLGAAADLADIRLSLGDAAGQEVGVGSLLPEGLPADGVLVLVIPGFTLECLDPATPAIEHWVSQGSQERSTVVLQWRLSHGFEVNGCSVGDLMQQFESVRDLRRRRAEEPERRQELERDMPADAEGGGEAFPLYIKTLTGRHIELMVHPSWTVAQTKYAYHNATGTPPDQQKLVCAGMELEDERTLASYNILQGTLVRLYHKLRGD